MNANLMRQVIDCIVKAAEKENGLSNIHLIGKRRKWHRCVWSNRKMTLFLYNDNTGSTKSIRIK